MVLLSPALMAVAGGFRALVPGGATLAMLTVVFGLGAGILQPAAPTFTRQWFPRRLRGVMGASTSLRLAGIMCSASLTWTLIAPNLGG